MGTDIQVYFLTNIIFIKFFKNKINSDDDCYSAIDSALYKRLKQTYTLENLFDCI